MMQTQCRCVCYWYGTDCHVDSVRVGQTCQEVLAHPVRLYLRSRCNCASPMPATGVAMHHATLLPPIQCRDKRPGIIRDLSTCSCSCALVALVYTADCKRPLPCSSMAPPATCCCDGLLWVQKR